MEVCCGERLFGNREWIKNMVVWRVVGALLLLPGDMG